MTTISYIEAVDAFKWGRGPSPWKLRAVRNVRPDAGQEAGDRPVRGPADKGFRDWAMQNLGLPNDRWWRGRAGRKSDAAQNHGADSLGGGNESPIRPVEMVVVTQPG